MLLPLLFAVVVNVISENARRAVINEVLYPDDIFPRIKIMKDFEIGRKC